MSDSQQQTQKQALIERQLKRLSENCWNQEELVDEDKF